MPQLFPGSIYSRGIHEARSACRKQEMMKSLKTRDAAYLKREEKRKFQIRACRMLARFRISQWGTERRRRRRRRNGIPFVLSLHPSLPFSFSANVGVKGLAARYLQKDQFANNIGRLPQLGGSCENCFSFCKLFCYSFLADFFMQKQ